MGLLIMAAIPTLGQTDIDELEIVNETNDDGGFIHDGLIRVQDDSFKFGFIDKTGLLTIPCKWVSVADLSLRENVGR